jgi:GTP-binding protein
VVNAYALWKIQERGTLFVEPGAEVYEGMVIGLNSRSNDLVVNPIKGKKLTNIRASGKDEHIELKNVMNLTLEKGLTVLGEDELLEVTPLFLRVRKKTLTESERRKESRSNVS